MVEIKYSKRRRSIGITVTVDGRVVVAAPAGVTPDRINEALNRHRVWIARQQAARQQAWAAFMDGFAFYLGRPYRLTITEQAKALVEICGVEIRVQPPADGLDWWPRLQTWYQGEAATHITAGIRRFAPSMGLTPRRPLLKEWKRRWGECHPNGDLKFNWRLIMLPWEIIDYVVVHELAHLKVPGHNPRFWRVVAATLPDYAPRRQWLRARGGPFLVWRPAGEQWAQS
jgi:predicted metal-dependent hydrolase